MGERENERERENTRGRMGERIGEREGTLWLLLLDLLRVVGNAHGQLLDLGLESTRFILCLCNQTCKKEECMQERG